MMRVGGLGFELDVNAEPGARIGKLILLGANTQLEMDKTYLTAGWGFDLGGVAGSSMIDVLETYITKRRRVGTERVTSVTLKTTN
jgi:sulfur-oxidizing protein SoxB